MTNVIDRFGEEWAKAAKTKWRAHAVPASSITPTAIRWVWPGWIALGKLTILGGAGGSGKTTLSIGLIATLTSAGRWPDGTPCGEPRSALIWSSEDDPADTIIPRLIAAGADLSKVHILQGRINDLGETEPFDPAKDADLLAAELERLGDVGLIMIDPIVSMVAGDMHRANDVRRALQPLVDLAEKYDCSVLGITHFSKGSAGSNPAERVLGSQAFGALARTVLVAAKQEDSDLRVLARAKSNIAEDSGGCSYSIMETTVRDHITTTVVTWGDTISGSAREILADVERVESDDPDLNDDPAECLRRILKDNPLESNEAKALMKSNGFTEKQTRRAREKLGVVTVRSGSKKDVKTHWSLPNESHDSLLMPSEPYSCPSLRVGMSEKKGHELEKRAFVDPPFLPDEDRQNHSKTATKKSGGLREKVAVFGSDAAAFTEGGGAATDTIDALSDHTCPLPDVGIYEEKGHLWADGASMATISPEGDSFDEADQEEL